jgi:hypothetical protein
MKEKLDVSWKTNAKWSGSTPLNKRSKPEKQNVNGSGNGNE